MATPNQIAYSASKWAVEAATEALAHEVYRFGVRVYCIEPGVVATNIFDNSADMTRYDKASPYQQIMRRNGKFYSAGFKAPASPQQFADAILTAVSQPQYQFTGRSVLMLRISVVGLTSLANNGFRWVMI